MTGTEMVFIFGVSCNGEDKDKGIATYTYYMIPTEVAEQPKGVVIQHIRTHRPQANVFLAPIGEYSTLSIIEKSRLPKRDGVPTTSLLRPAQASQKEKIRSL